MSQFRLYVADAIDTMRAQADESIDLIVTDTAYESLEKHRAVGTTTRLKQSDASSNEWFEIFRNERFPEFFHEAMRVLKKNAHLYFYCDEETADVAKPMGRAAGFTFWKSIVWAKTRQGMTPDADDLTVEHQAMGMGYHFRSSKEFILFFEKGKRKLSDLGVRDVLPFPIVRGGYPTEKPVDLNKVLIRLSSEPGETVLDPFMGSASAGVAAMKLGRVFVGGDLKESAVLSAEKRLKQAGGESPAAPTVIAVAERAPFVAPEPAKRKRAKKPPTPEDFFSAAEAGGIAERDVPLGAAEAARDIREHEEQLGSRPVRIGAGVLETLDALGVPHREGPRQMFEVKVLDGPLPAVTEPSFVEQIKAAFAVRADPGCSLDLLEPEPVRALTDDEINDDDLV